MVRPSTGSSIRMIGEIVRLCRNGEALHPASRDEAQGIWLSKLGLFSVLSVNPIPCSLARWPSYRLPPFQWTGDVSKLPSFGSADGECGSIRSKVWSFYFRTGELARDWRRSRLLLNPLQLDRMRRVSLPIKQIVVP